MYVYNTEELAGRKIGTGAITSDEQTQSDAITALEKLVPGIWYISANGLQSAHGSRSLIRLLAYIRENFRSKVEFVGAGNTFTHIVITLV